MKDVRYANRGQPLEQFIKYANERYRQQGLAVIHKNATEFIPIRDRHGKIVSCKVEGKATFDFLGRYKHYPIAIEAKNTNDATIRWDRIEDNQAIDMDDFCSQAGAIGLVIVSFNLDRFYAIPWAFWSEAYHERVRLNNRKSDLTVSAFGTTWTIPKKASFRIDEIPPEFEVEKYDFSFGFNYLGKAEKYIVQQPINPRNRL